MGCSLYADLRQYIWKYLSPTASNCDDDCVPSSPAAVLMRPQLTSTLHPPPSTSPQVQVNYKTLTMFTALWGTRK